MTTATTFDWWADFIVYIFFQNKPLAVQPIDFESFVARNKTLIQNDPQRELLIYPNDDVSVSVERKNYNFSLLISSIHWKID